MRGRPGPGRAFGWLWAAYAVSAYGTGLGFGAFSVLAVLVLHEGPAAVSALAAAGLAAGAVVAVPLGPWVEFRRKRPVMIGTDLVRCAALLSIPVAFALGRLTFGQLVLVAVVVAAARIAFTAASGAYLKSVVPREHLLTATGRFEATTWSATIVGPPLGGAAIGLLGPVITVLADAASYLLSALGIRQIGGAEARPERVAGVRLRPADLVDGWRHILTHPVLRPLFVNVLAVNALIMVGEPLMAVLMLGRLGFPPWQYGLAFALPCVGGLIGARLARRLVARFGRRPVLLGSGVLRAVWPVGLALTGRGLGGLLLVGLLQFGLVTCCGVFNPVLSAYRLEQTPAHLVARTLSSWSISTSTSIAVLTALGGVLGSLAGPRAGLAVAGALLLLTPLALPRKPFPATPSGPPGTARSARWSTSREPAASPTAARG